MPVYNGEKYIKETIESVINQSFVDFEFIIIDDGSTDNTLNIINDFQDDRIKIIKQNHGGIVKALNTGLQNSKGEYIIRIDADDICVQNRFDELLNFMNENIDIVICGSWADVIDESGNIIDELKHPPVDDKDIRRYIKIHNPFIHPSVIFRRDIIDKVGAYRNFKHNEDYELWTRILPIGEGHNIPQKLIKYRIHSKQITRKANLQMRLFGVIVRLLAFFRN